MNIARPQITSLRNFLTVGRLCQTPLDALQRMALVTIGKSAAGEVSVFAYEFFDLSDDAIEFIDEI